MSGFSDPIIGGGGALVYPAIHSPNFDGQAGTGWSIDKNGRATFYELTTGAISLPLMLFMGPSGDKTGATDSATLNAFLSAGASVVMLPGTYYGAITVEVPIGQYVVGSGMAGAGNTIYNWVGSALGAGDAFRISNSGAYSQLTVGGGIQNLVIDGSTGPAGSCGIHAGDIESLTFDRTLIRHFNTAGAIGYHFDNQYHYTERLSGRLETIDCTTAVVFDVTSNTGPSPDSSTPSFARPDLVIYITTFDVSQSGVILQNGAIIYDQERLSIRGNFTGAEAGTAGAVLTLTGTVPDGHSGAGAGSRIELGRLDVGVETTGGTVTAQTISFGSAGNVVLDCSGVMDFGSQGAGIFTGSNNSENMLRYLGPVYGDATLPSGVFWGTHTVSAALGDGSTIFAEAAQIMVVAAAADVTGIIMQAGGRNGQTVSVVNTSAFTITFAAASSNVSGGSAVSVPAGGQLSLTWIEAQSLWYPG